MHRTLQSYSMLQICQRAHSQCVLEGMQRECIGNHSSLLPTPSDACEQPAVDADSVYPLHKNGADIRPHDAPLQQMISEEQEASNVSSNPHFDWLTGPRDMLQLQRTADDILSLLDGHSVAADSASNSGSAGPSPHNIQPNCKTQAEQAETQQNATDQEAAAQSLNSWRRSEQVKLSAAV